MFSSQTKQQRRSLLGARPLAIHFILLLFVFLYAFLGGLAFQLLEEDALELQRKETFQHTFDCVAKVLEEDSENRTINDTVDATSKCWNLERDERSDWGFMTATLYGFGIVTTLGYNRIAPITTPGRLFCMLYGIVGIPITMIIIASVGQYLREFAVSCRQKMQTKKIRRRMSMFLAAQDELDEEASIELVSIAVLVVFFLYIAFGAWLLPLLNGQSDFINGLYYNFLCLTAMDFGQLAPEKVIFVPVTLCYVCFGLAITTIAIEVMANYMRRLHFIGRRVKNVANTSITFGGKTLRVKDLLQAVSKKCGIDPKIISKIDLDKVVERTIAMRDGVDISDDSDSEDFHPQEPKPFHNSLAPSCPRRPNGDKDNAISLAENKNTYLDNKNSVIHVVVSDERAEISPDQPSKEKREAEKKIGKLPPPEEIFLRNPRQQARRKLTPRFSVNNVKELSTFFDKIAETSESNSALQSIADSTRTSSSSPPRKPLRTGSFTPATKNTVLRQDTDDKGRRHSTAPETFLATNIKEDETDDGAPGTSGRKKENEKDGNGK
uniref:Ion channel n=1 Tax=Steinernema glaseri TaxID=37863 RepID=A0A1I7ZCC5_9BILA